MCRIGRRKCSPRRLGTGGLHSAGGSRRVVRCSITELTSRADFIQSFPYKKNKNFNLKKNSFVTYQSSEVSIKNVAFQPDKNLHTFSAIVPGISVRSRPTKTRIPGAFIATLNLVISACFSFDLHFFFQFKSKKIHRVPPVGLVAPAKQLPVEINEILGKSRDGYMARLEQHLDV